MSAYVVDRHHIVYLVEAAMSRTITTSPPFTWWHGDNPNPDQRHHRLDGDDLDEWERVTNMLWQENIKSVQCRYPDTYNNPQDMPGPIDEDFRITQQDHRFCLWDRFDPVQVLKACNCYRYQSCEHPAWESSEAHAFIQSLKSHAISSLPGYENAEWGAPKPSTNAVRLS